MPKCALLNPENEIERIEDNIDPSVQTKEDYRWLPYIDSPSPPYNPSTHTLNGYTNVVNEDNVTKTWNLVAKTAEEVAEYSDTLKNIDLDRAGRAVFEILFEIANRVRVLEGSPSITKVQFRNYLKSLI